MTIFDTLWAARRTYETPDTPPDVWNARLTSVQAAQLLTRVIWPHRDEGWGLLAKSTGNHTQQPRTGINVAADIVTNLRTGLHFDVLIDGPDSTLSYAGHAIPSFGDKGPFDRARFVAPVEPPELATPPPAVPPPPPPLLELPPLAPELAALLHRHDLCSDTLTELHRFSLRAEQSLVDLAAALAALQAATAKGLEGSLPWLGTVKLRPPKA